MNPISVIKTNGWMIKKFTKAKEKENNAEKRKEHFTNLVNNYQNTEYNQEKWKHNIWGDWETDESNWHTKTKCSKQGLHLVVHHLEKRRVNKHSEMDS